MTLVGAGSNDPTWVQTQYASETGLAARMALFREVTGPDARELVIAAGAEARPRRVLEVGCGEGELAERVASNLDVEVVALDQSSRMVEIARGRGVDARIGDVQELPFEDETFDAAIAAWMLYHVGSSDSMARYCEGVPESKSPLVVRRRPVVFVADEPR